MQSDEILDIDTKQLSTRVLILFVVIEFIYLLLDITINYNPYFDYGPMNRLFNLAREDGFAAWFMNAQTLITALVL